MTTNPAKDEAPAGRAGGGWKALLTPRRIIGGVIAIIALLFIFQNTGSGSFHFLFFDVKAPRWLWLIGVFAAGFATCWFWMRYRSRSKEPAKQ